MINLLDELESEAGGQLTQENSSQSVIGHKMSSETVITINHTQSRFDPVNENISNINLICNQIDKLYGIKKTGLPNEQQRALRNMDECVLKATPLIRETKILLENAKASHITQKKKKQMKKTDDIMFQNMFNSAARNYQTVIVRYQGTTDKFRNAVRDDFTRQAKIVDPDISQQQIQQMLEASNPAQYLQTHIMAISPQLLDEVEELEKEHQRVKRLENTIQEIQQLFNSCAILVVAAGEKLDQIETNVENTMTSAQKGKESLIKAEHYEIQRRKTKFKMFAAIFLCVIIVVIILIIIFFK